jgi:hypothetical protein
VADTCPVCREPVPHGRDLTWLTILGILLGFWRGYIWMPGGFAHRRCFGAFAATARRTWSRDG